MKHKTLIIHAGSHKTGSSAIQRYLFEQREKLPSAGVQYLHRGSANSSLWMLRAFKRDLADLPAFSHLELDESGLAQLRAHARQQLKEIATDSTAPLSVLSAESIGSFTLGELQDLHEFTSALYSRVIVHQYFRPMKSRMESAYQERLKHGFVSLNKKFHLGYNRRIELLDTIFGRENVNIYKYDSRVFPDGDVVSHFLSALNISPVDRFEHKPLNAGMSLSAVRLLYVYRQFHPNLMEGDRAIVRQLKQAPGEPFRFHSDLFQELLATGPNAVVLFEQRVGFSITEDVEADDAIGITSEQALSEIPQSSLDWLQQQVESLGGVVALPPEKTDLEAIAGLVSQLGHE